MKKKKLWSSVPVWLASFLFISSWVVFGVTLALKTTNVGLNGNVTFTATAVYAKVTGSVTGTKTTNTLRDITIDASTTDESQSWDDVAFDFVNEDTPIVTTITVENMSDERSIWVSFEEYFSVKNVTFARTADGSLVSSFSTIEIPALASKSFKIEMSVKDKNTSVSGGFDFRLNLVSKEPTTVASAQEFVNTLKSAQNSQEYSLIKLTQNIDLTSLTESDFAMVGDDNESYCYINFFKGEFDGGGHTIKMNAVGKSNYAFLFGQIEGKIKNLNLEFDAENVQTALGYIASGNLELRDITSTGDVSFTGSVSGYSPLVQKAQCECISFVNCTNNVNITAGGADSYGSAFLGNRAKGGATSSSENKIYSQYSEGATSDYKSKHILLERKVVFDGCVNNGTIMMGHAALLYGNCYDLPDMNNFVVKNCVNNGQILGTSSAGYICQINAGKLDINNGDTAKSMWHRGQYLAELEAYTATNVTENGVVTEVSLSGVTVETNSNKEIVITNTNSGTYQYVVEIQGTYSKLENGQKVQSLNATATFTFNSAGNTGLKLLQIGMVTDSANKKLAAFGTTYTYESLSEPIANATLDGVLGTALRIATLSSGKQFYVIETSTTENIENASSHRAISVSTYEVTSSGNVLKDVKSLYV